MVNFRRLRRKDSRFYLKDLNSIALQLDLSVASSRYQESTGATLAADGDNLGLLLSVERWGGQTLDQVLATQTELVVNGDFLTDVSGWTFAGVGGISWDNGRLYLNSTATWQGPFQDVSTLVVGNQYSWSFDYEKDTCTDFYVSGTAEVSGYRPVASSSGHETKMFQASATAMRMHFRNGNTSGNSTSNFWIGDVSIKKIPSLAFKQTNGPQIPKYYANPDWMVFDGVDDEMPADFDGASLPALVSIFAIINTIDDYYVLIKGQDNSHYLGYSYVGSGLSISAGAGSPLTYVDNALIADVRRDLQAATNDGVDHIVEFRNVACASFTQFNISGWSGNPRYDGKIGRDILIIPNGQELDGNRDNIIAAMIEGYGVTLA